MGRGSGKRINKIGRPYGDGTDSDHEKLQGIRSGHDAAHADKGIFTAR